MAYGDVFSQRELPVLQTLTIHDLVNQTLAQMTLSMSPLESSWDFLQHNPLVESYTYASIPNQFSQLKLETYNGSSNPTHHMMRFTTQMYVYNASDSTHCRLFPSFLTEKDLALYAHLPPRSITSFKDLGEKFIQTFFLSLFSAHFIFSFKCETKIIRFSSGFYCPIQLGCTGNFQFVWKKIYTGIPAWINQHCFLQKIGTKGTSQHQPLLSKIQKFIHADDYVRWKGELDNKFKEYQSPKKPKQGELKPKPTILERLIPWKPNVP